MPQRNSNGLAIVVIVLSLSTLAALGYYAVQPMMKRIPPDEARQTGKQNQNPPQDLDITIKPKANDLRVRVLSPHYQGGELSFIATETDVPKGEDPHVFAVNEYLSKVKAVPQDGRLKSCQVSNGVATADFTPALQSGYGTEDEQTVVNGILAAFGAFDDVKYVRFLVDGQPIDTLGNIELKDPQPVLHPDSLASPTDKPKP